MIVKLPQPQRAADRGEARLSWRQILVVTAVTLVAVVPLLAFALYAHQTLSATVLAERERQRASAARVTAGLLQEEFARLAAEMDDEAGDARNADAFARADQVRLGRELDNLLADFPLAVAAAALGRDGTSIASRGDASFLDAPPESFRSGVVAGVPLAVAHRASPGSSGSILVAVSVRGPGGPQGTFVIALEPTRLLRGLSAWMNAPETVLEVIDETGQLMIAGERPGAPSEWAEDVVFSSSAPLQAPAWTVRAIERRSTALAYRDELLLRLDAASGVATLTIFVLMWLRARLHLQLRRQERALRERAARQTALLEAQSDLGEMLLVHEEGRLTAWNQAALDMTARTGAELAAAGAPEELFIDPDGMLARSPEGASIELQLRVTGGEGPWIEIARQPLSGGGMLIIGRDITQRRALQRELQERATHDRVTGLPNRALLEDRIAHAAARMKRRGDPFSVVVLDIDLFKSVNDTLGHHAGDQLLVELGQRVKSALRDQDTVARLGGDEFAILVEETDAAGAETVARRIAEALRPTFVIAGRELPLSASIGIAVAPTDGEDADALIRRADLAMYEAKQQRGSYRFFAKELEERTLADVRVVTELRRALEEGQLELHYQPKIGARTGGVAGIEALVRWRHPTRGLLGPETFVPHAVRARLGFDLDSWTLRSALVAARTWRRMGLTVPVSVNVGAATVEHPEFVEMVRTTLQASGVDPDSLVLELTEDAMLSEPRRVGDILRQLTAEGIRVSIDDFGTGYSSLLFVQHLPASELKIDRAFISDLISSDADQKIVRAAVALARSLDMTATAEGVEDASTWDLLQELGCDQGQGYLFTPALSIDELMTWLLERGTDLDHAAIRRYADRLLQTIDSREPTLSAASARIENERDGVRAVLAWAVHERQVELALALAAGLRRHWCDSGQLDEASYWLGSVLAAAHADGTAKPESMLDALDGLAVVMGQQGDLEAARALLAVCVEAARAAGADRVLARALTDLGVAAHCLGELETAEQSAAEAARLFGASGQRVAEARQDVAPAPRLSVAGGPSAVPAWTPLVVGA